MSFKTFLRLFVKASSESRYRSSLREAVRGLWTGAFDDVQFYDAMLVTIRQHLTQAWHEGAAECGILPAELTQDERRALERAIRYEEQWIDGLADATMENSRENGGLLGPLFSRLEIWIGRWSGVKSEAMAMACADKKLKWVLGETDHCRSCLALSGKVKRASFWYERGILPRVHGATYLECNGFRCQCALVPTSDRASPGPLPSLP